MNTESAASIVDIKYPPAFEKWWQEHGIRPKPLILELAYKEIAFKGWSAGQQHLRDEPLEQAAADLLATAQLVRQVISDSYPQNQHPRSTCKFGWFQTAIEQMECFQLPAPTMPK